MKEVSKKEIVCYGIGDFACNGFCAIVFSYLMFFYTDVAGLSLNIVGGIIFISRLWDAVGCLVMGRLIDKTCTRWGKARPYLLWTSIPVCIMLVALFFIPFQNNNAKSWYALVIAIIYSLFYSGLSVAYSTMMSCMTRDDKERLVFNVAKNISSNLGAFFVTSVTLHGVDFFGRGDQEKGFMLVMFLFAVLYFVLILICFKNTCERVELSSNSFPLKDSFKIAAKNRCWVVLCVLEFFMLLGMTMRNQGTLYYASYYLENENLGTILLSMSTFLAVPMAVLVTKAAERIGKVQCITTGNVLLIAGMGVMYLAKKNIPLVLAGHIIASVGNGLASGLIFVMIAEVVDYSESQTGIRPQGLLTSTVSLMMKLGSACAGVLSAKILELGGYTAGSEQSSKGMIAITTNYFWGPIILAGICLIVAQFYKLNKRE